MFITSIAFAGFVVAVLAVYYLLPRRPQNYWLLLVSYIFYVTWAWEFAVVLLALTLANFFLGRAMQNGKKWPLWTGIGLNVLALAFFKYADFFVPGALAVLSRFGVRAGGGAIAILLPVGLSFRVVELISYLVDVRRGQVEDAPDLVDFALYLAYFPKLVSGPIERARVFLPKLAGPRRVDNDMLARSFTLVVVGLIRKMIIADMLAIMIPSDLFQSPERLSGPKLAVWLVSYGYFLYNDFAGYTGIVRGVSGFFGIELSANFRVPFAARNFTEFWNRWHITLSHWLRDYIYFPVSRVLLRRNPSRRNVLNLLLPPVATMLVSALWHQASWHMLVWGALHGLYQIVNRIPSLWGPVTPPQKQPLWRQGLGIVFVFVLATLAFAFFAADIPVALAYWRGLLNWSNLSLPSPQVFLILIPAVWLDWVEERGGEFAFLGWPRLAQATLLAIAVLALFLISQSDLQSPPFVYQGF
jgi:alginate O-acetyltransferase complex protein AlgI